MTNGLLQRLRGSGTATILRRSPGEIVFAVDDVTPVTEALPLEEATAHAARRLGEDLLASSIVPGEMVVKIAAWRHPLVAAVHQAFAEHRPLCLSPDTIWLTIAQGFSHHVAQHAEELRDRLVLHQGKERLSVDVRELTKPEHWAAAVMEWAKLIDDRSPADAARLLVCDFSTTTPTIRTASQIVLMEAFRHYFDYSIRCICGIPEITLTGTPKDWRSVRDRVRRLTRFDLGWWTGRLLPICDAFVRTSEGHPPLAFWQSIYKPQDAYGGEVITGWLADLFPYLTDPVTNAPTRRNPILNVPRWQITVKNGLAERNLPMGLAKAPLRLTLPNSKARNLEVVGGFLGVVEKRSDDGVGALEPMIGWGVRPGNPFTTLLEALLDRAEQPLPAPMADVSQAAMRHGWGFPSELIQLLELSQGPTFRFLSDTTLKIRVHPAEEYLRFPDWSPDYDSKGRQDKHVVRFGEMSDGRVIACLHYYREPESYDPTQWIMGSYEWWVLVGRQRRWWNPRRGIDEMVMPAEEATVVATSLPSFFERLLASPDRPFFDAPDFVPEEKL